MIFQKTTFERLFPAALYDTGTTSFGFESGGKRYFDVTVPGKPKIEQGMTVIALLEKPNAWSFHGVLGWIDCQDGSIACDSPGKSLLIALVCAFFAIMFPIRAYAAFSNSEYVNLIAFVVASIFGMFALRYLYFYAKALIIRRALVTIRDFIELKQQSNG
ncbi:hypothetical protein LH51_11960 [Nitrincola sp. A-D6]|uniref:hypothetical protein n=2 Tax=Nitrincola sp. A-D6 TaxID=1545442 RepID=UPI00051F8BA7|nr:hypothetical protein [Nitrincola sp. A-D6]KGK41807.1 hypothetical protein LH51_11960 [Nitrincola sp. A-D6]